MILSLQDRSCEFYIQYHIHNIIIYFIIHFLGEPRVASLYLSHSPCCKTTYTIDIIFFPISFFITVTA